MKSPAAPVSEPSASVLDAMWREQGATVRRIFGYAFVCSLLALAPTVFMLQVYDRVLNSRSAVTLLMLVVLVLGVHAAMQVMGAIITHTLQALALWLDEKLTARLFHAALEAGPRSGAQMALQDLRTLREFLPSAACQALFEAPGALLYLAILFILSPWLGVLSLAGAMAQVALGLRTERRVSPGLAQAGRAASDAQAFAAMALRQGHVVEAMAMRDGLRSQWLRRQGDHLRWQAEASDAAGLNASASRFLQMLMSSLLLGAAAWMTLTGHILGGGGMMIIATTLGGKAVAPLAAVLANWRNIALARAARDRLDLGLSALQEAPPAMPLPAPRGQLTVEGIMASPPGTMNPVLRGVSFQAQPGQVLVVVGPSASGKSSLARAVVGVWPVMSGKVRLDGADVHAWNRDDLGRHVGYLSQDVELFEGSLADNIARFATPDAALLAQAVADAGLQALVASLPQGLDTPVGEGGAFLSGGQRQRVGLARALYGRPCLIVLDEPNASLDEAGDLALSDALLRMKSQGCTLIVMSHRTSILPVADRMLVMRDGQVSLQGSRDEVMAALQQGGGARPAPTAVPAATLAGGRA